MEECLTNRATYQHTQPQSLVHMLRWHHFHWLSVWPKYGSPGRQVLLVSYWCTRPGMYCNTTFPPDLVLCALPGLLACWQAGKDPGNKALHVCTQSLLVGILQEDGGSKLPDEWVCTRVFVMAQDEGVLPFLISYSYPSMAELAEQIEYIADHFQYVNEFYFHHITMSCWMAAILCVLNLQAQRLHMPGSWDGGQRCGQICSECCVLSFSTVQLKQSNKQPPLLLGTLPIFMGCDLFSSATATNEFCSETETCLPKHPRSGQITETVSFTAQQNLGGSNKSLMWFLLY